MDFIILDHFSAELSLRKTPLKKSTTTSKLEWQSVKGRS